LDKIFDRFYQANNHYQKDSEGTGIGLALIKELVEVCKGEIAVESVQNKTTSFTITLPIAKDYFKDDEIVKDSEMADRKQEAEKQQPIEDEMFVTNTDSSERSPVSGLQSPLILIVEDNPDVTSYICSFMENDYRIITAENGKDGLKKTFDKYPDLVISDVMMPEMDGFELCQKIKSDERISHIPVILLTAKADLDSRIEGLEYGADDYINKPFESAELKIRVRNLIKQRKRLREKFSRLIEIKPGDVTASSMDEQFMERLIFVFEKHISESGYTTEHFAKDVGFSKTHLNRKLKAITDLSIHAFILNLRLKRAAQLLKKKAATVSEIAYSVGFESPSNFARAFRAHYGQSPRDFSSEF
jgi:YesN/AraC family two-component response regulator